MSYAFDFGMSTIMQTDPHPVNFNRNHDILSLTLRRQCNSRPMARQFSTVDDSDLGLFEPIAYVQYIFFKEFVIFAIYYKIYVLWVVKNASVSTSSIDK